MRISTGFLDIVFREKDLHMALYNGYILFFFGIYRLHPFPSILSYFFKGRERVSFVSAV